MVDLYIRVLVGGQGVGMILYLLGFFSCAFFFCSLKRLEQDSRCVFFVYHLLSFSLIPLTRI